MIGHVKYYLTPISRVLSYEEGELLGTGAYFEANQSKYIITNEHVAKHQNKSSLAHKFFGNETYIRLTNPAYAELAPADVAVSRIDQNNWNICEHNALAISIERFAVKHAPAKNELLFFAGYSGERSKFYFRHLITPGTPYLTQECKFPTSVKEANSKYHFALHYPPDLAKSVDGSSHLPVPQGFSGSLVWNTKRVAYYLAGSEWNPEMAEVTGIIWGWPSSRACILATKVEYMALSQLINNEAGNA